jgi:hypothetical protein
MIAQDDDGALLIGKADDVIVVAAALLMRDVAQTGAKRDSRSAALKYGTTFVIRPKP